LSFPLQEYPATSNIARAADKKVFFMCLLLMINSY
jgi:hypothetical protein